jgi:hypothetical protein
MLRFVTIKKFSELSGYSERAIRCKIDLGVWLEGVQYKRAPDNRILIDMEGYQKWVEEDQGPVLRRSPRRLESRSVWKDDGKEKPWR